MRRVGRGLRGVELLLRDDLLVGELLHAREIGHGLLSIRVGGRDLRVDDLTLARRGLDLRLRLSGDAANARDRHARRRDPRRPARA